MFIMFKYFLIDIANSSLNDNDLITVKEILRESRPNSSVFMVAIPVSYFWIRLPMIICREF